MPAPDSKRWAKTAEALIDEHEHDVLDPVERMHGESNTWSAVKLAV